MISLESILFLGDTHLRGPDDPNQEIVLRFLEDHSGGLVILGDFFDFMAGHNQVAIAVHEPILRALEAWVPLHFVEGNHDFDLSPNIPGLRAATIHPSEAIVDLLGIRCHLCHGDRTNPADASTRLLRRALQSKPVRLLRDSILPDGVIFAFAMAFANWSRRHSRNRPEDEATVRAAAIERLQSPDIDAVFYGHTHRPRLERLDNGIIANPGCSIPGGSYLRLTHHALTLHRFPDGQILPPGPVPIRARPVTPG